MKKYKLICKEGSEIIAESVMRIVEKHLYPLVDEISELRKDRDKYKALFDALAHDTAEETGVSVGDVEEHYLKEVELL